MDGWFLYVFICGFDFLVLDHQLWATLRFGGRAKGRSFRRSHAFAFSERGVTEERFGKERGIGMSMHFQGHTHKHVQQ